MKALAPAKVNLVLRVGPRRRDGYHELASLIVALDVGDVVELEVAAQTTVEAPGLAGGDTLVRRALDLLVEASGHPGGFAVQLDKHLPVGAGLGGGSADAGVALVLANRLLATPLETPELLALAAKVGSDVPFFVQGSPAAELRGRGELVRPLRLHAEPVIALAWPGEIARHGRRLRRLSQSVERGRASRARARASRSPLARTCGPSRPSSRTISRTLPSACARRRRRFGGSSASAGALVATVSGSGSAVFGLFEHRDEAEQAISSLTGAAWSAVARVVDLATMTPS